LEIEVHTILRMTMHISVHRSPHHARLDANHATQRSPVFVESEIRRVAALTLSHEQTFSVPHAVEIRPDRSIFSINQIM